MKVALAHDWLTGMRGGERVLQALLELFPNAPLYTLIHIKNSTNSFIENRTIHTSFLNQIPGIQKNYRKFLPLFPMAAESLKLPSDIDLLISSSHCVIKGIKKDPHTKHISYIHSPMRYIYDQFDAYFGSHAALYQQWGAKLFRSYLTDWDIKSNENVDLLIANSQFVAKRMRDFYERDSIVVHPFVDFLDFKKIWDRPPIKKNQYCMVTAFAPNKRVDLAIEAFNKNQKELYIVGEGQEEARLKSMAQKNIHFLGRLKREEIIGLLASSKGLVFPGVEDFGIAPLEAVAALTPVLAFAAGGVLETLNEKVAVFFNKQTSDDLNSALQLLERKQFQSQDFIDQVKSFSKEIFQRDIMLNIQKVMNGK